MFLAFPALSWISNHFAEFVWFTTPITGAAVEEFRRRKMSTIAMRSSRPCLDLLCTAASDQDNVRKALLDFWMRGVGSSTLTMNITAQSSARVHEP